MKYYKVKLLEGHKAKPEDIVNGYLGNVFNDGEVCVYTRGEAIKKAGMFGGKIEVTTEPVNIGYAETRTVADYGYYCDDKLGIDEVPLSFIDWQQATAYAAE